MHTCETDKRVCEPCCTEPPSDEQATILLLEQSLSQLTLSLVVRLLVSPQLYLIIRLGTEEVHEVFDQYDEEEEGRHREPKVKPQAIA